MTQRKIFIQAAGGFTLLEVLITVVIFSVGLLGLAGLQATGIKVNHSSLLRTQATLLAYDIADCMRANKGVDADTNNQGDNLPGYIIGVGSDHGTPANMAQTDINQWKQNLAQALPGGDGAIALAGNRATIDVSWDDTRGVGVAKIFTLVTDI